MKTWLTTVAMTAMVSASVATQQLNWIEFKAKNNEFKIQLPDTYMLIDRNNPEYQENQKRIMEENPRLAEMIQAGEQREYALFLVNLGAVEPGKYTDNMNAVVQPASGLTAGMFPAVWTEIQKGIPFKARTSGHETVKHKHGDLLRYWGTMEVEAGGQKVDVELFGNLLLRRDKIYVVTFSCAGGEMKERRKVYEKAIDSMTF